jgi:hypothetical protein
MMKRFTILDISSYEDYEYTMLSSLVKENYYINLKYFL